jgi:hypothetical protein
MNNWKCPICKSLLINGENKKYETLCDHVCNPNMDDHPYRPTYICPNKECKANIEKVFWDESGDIYGGFKIKENEFINLNDAPFGSLARKLNVEIYRRGGLKRKIYLSPALTLWIYKPFIEYHYTSNTDGDILSRSWKLGFLKKDKILNNNYCVVVISWFSIWKYLWKYRFRNNNIFEKSINRNFPYRLFEFFLKIIYFRKYLKYTKDEMSTSKRS